MSLRFGIVGCGAIAEEMHFPTLESSPGVELVAAVDSDLDHARKVAASHGVAIACADIGELDGRVDAVVLCTPPSVRPRLLEQAFALGLHVLAEKPLANSSPECADAIAASRRAGKSLAVSHMFRFYPVRARMREAVAAHGLGEILRVQIHEGAPYAWETRSGYTFRRGEVSGGVVANAGIHSLDSLIQWFGDPTIEAYEDDSAGGLESNARARLCFGHGVRADFRISRTCRLQNLFRVECERGVLEFSNRDTVAYRVEREGRRSEHKLDGDLLTPADCWRSQLADFVRSVETGHAPAVDGPEACRVVELVEQMYALKQARPLPTVASQPGATW
jgi:predicted dehydrogenase